MDKRQFSVSCTFRLSRRAITEEYGDNYLAGIYASDIRKGCQA